MLLAWISLLALAGCAFKPSESRIQEEYVGSVLDDAMRGYVDIVDFKKFDHHQPDGDTYVAEVKYKVVFRQSLAQLSSQFGKESQQAIGSSAGVESKVAAGIATASGGLALVGLRLEFGNFKAGDSFDRRAQVVYRRKNLSWQLASRPAL